ncbi:SAM-dependent methyltransferase [Streptomyces sp. G45]|uniref:SAM-dependent methyltransferase n=1 Tax=Streptomyces sp. G45 TaxID=3406627 RepID=UPI003C23450B
MTDTEHGSDAIDTSKPHPARMYDWYLGGKDSYPVDWEAAAQVKSFFPDVDKLARVNRRFMHHASRLLAERGLRQFLDVGTGIPTEPNLHQIVQAVSPDASVVYVDYDPIVLRHAEALLRSTPEGRTTYLQADVREPQKIIEGAREVLDFDRPIVLSLIALLHFLSDEHYQPQGLVRQLLDPLPLGSYLMLSHATGDFDPEAWQRIVELHHRNGMYGQVRSYQQFCEFFTGLDLIEPGVTLATDWAPGIVGDDATDAPLPLYVGVARKG